MADRPEFIQVVPGQIVTKSIVEPAPVMDGKIVADPGKRYLEDSGN